MSEIHQYKLRNGSSPAWYDEGTGPTPDAWHLDCVQPDHIWRTVYQQGYAAALAQTAGVVDGWKLVPVEPTEVMCEAAMSSLGWTRSEAAAKTAPITPASPMMEGSMKVWSAMLAAAPAASGVHPDALPDGTLSKSTAKRVEALASASVSERARELADEWRHVLDDGEDGHELCASRNTVARLVNAIDALEQALTQQRDGDAQDKRALAKAVFNIPVPGRGFHEGWRDEEIWQWALRAAAAHILGATQSETEKLFTTPQPSADAVREDSARLDWIESQIREYGDGYTEPREAGWGIQWQQERPDHYWPGLRAWIDEERRRASGDELESLLSAASGEGVGK